MAALSISEPRPWTIGGRPKKRTTKLKTPHVNTYFRQIQTCQELYSKLKLDTTNNKLITSPFPKIQLRERTFLSLPPGRSTGNDSMKDLENDSQRTTSSEDIHRMDTDRRHCVRMTPKRLCEYLFSKGFGQPHIYSSSQMKRQNETIIKHYPQPFYTRSPKLQSTRDILKGQAKLDYKMANLRAGAFIEEHQTGIMQTTSQQDRKIHFVDEDVRDGVRSRRKVPSDNSIGLVKSPLSKKEHFKRIEAWLDDVEKAQKDIVMYDYLDNRYLDNVNESSGKLIKSTSDSTFS